jgi:hypothetical protein
VFDSSGAVVRHIKPLPARNNRTVSCSSAVAVARGTGCIASTAFHQVRGWPGVAAPAQHPLAAAWVLATLCRTLLGLAGCVKKQWMDRTKVRGDCGKATLFKHGQCPLASSAALRFHIL